jgi:putative nucleotidyltransferase-like protein
MADRQGARLRPANLEDAMDRDRDDPANTAAHSALCAALKGADAPISTVIVDAARRHGIHLVLAHVGGGVAQDDGIRAALSADLRKAAIADLLREAILRRLLADLAAAGVNPLLIKGAGLAYTLYRQPHLRPRGDVDLLIRRADLETADRALVAAGWRRAVEQTSERVTSQRHYALGETPSIAEQLDVHWKIAVPQIFGDTLGFEELAARAVPIAALGPAARTLSRPDALLLACLHRVAHHQDAIDLLWLWDIHLLASGLSDPERALFTELAIRRSMRAVCVRGLELAWGCFATPRVMDLIDALRPAAADPPEPSMRFLGGGLRQVDLLRGDLATLSGWRARVALVGGHLFPNAAYMRSMYPRWPVAALPFAYVHRIVRGAPKWFRRPDTKP